jgi:hypothetical protein
MTGDEYGSGRTSGAQNGMLTIYLKGHGNFEWSVDFRSALNKTVLLLYTTVKGKHLRTCPDATKGPYMLTKAHLAP